MATQDLLSAARGLMEDRPEGLLQRLVAHSQKLLDTPDLEVRAGDGRLRVFPSSLGLVFTAQHSQALFHIPATYILIPMHTS